MIKNACITGLFFIVVMLISCNSFVIRKIIPLEPENNSKNISPDVVFKWEYVGSSETDVEYEIYFGEYVSNPSDENLHLIKSGLKAKQYKPEFELFENKTYIWQIRMLSKGKEICRSVVMRFETVKHVENVEMILMKSGIFTMGNTRNDCDGGIDEVAHQVNLTYDYEISEKEISNAQFLLFLNNSADISSEGILKGRPVIKMNSEFCEIEYAYDEFTLKKEKKGKENYPVILVTWWGATEYCNWLSETSGLSKSYDLNGTLLNYPDNNGYRLPTESEWEYSARGGENDVKTDSDYIYSGSDDIEGCAWYLLNSENPEHPIYEGKGTHETGIKSANEAGIHDMSGNVLEWCHDWYGNYKDTPQTNPAGPLVSSGRGRVVRGGCWSFDARCCRVPARLFLNPDSGYSYLGFRIVRTCGEF